MIYPVYCGWCGTVVRNDGPVEGSTGICPACLAELRKESDRQFTPMADRTIKFDLGLSDEIPWRDEYTEQRRALIHESWQRPSSFIDGFLIGGSVAILLGILAEYIFHLNKL